MHKASAPRPRTTILHHTLPNPNCTGSQWTRETAVLGEKFRERVPFMRVSVCVCVCLLLQDLVQSRSRGGRGIVEDMCYERRRAKACESAIVSWVFQIKREKFRLLKRSRHRPLQENQRGSRLGSLYYDNITTLTTCPRRSRGCG